MRITQAADDLGRTVTYAYDASGRLQSVTDPAGGVEQYTYDANNRASAWNGMALSYDANGNLLGFQGDTYSWNSRDELAGITGTNSATFQYDALGRRQAKTVGGTQTAFLYDGANPVQELSGATVTANLLTGLRI